jgi:hypothetical protein
MGMLAAKRFSDGMTIDEYVSQMRENRERFLANLEHVRIAEHHLAALSGEPLHILVITEDWCADSVDFVPVVAKLERELPNVEVRVLRRDEHPDLAGNYPTKDGNQAIPIFIFLDAAMQEIGSLIERPAGAAAEIAAQTRRFQQAHPELPGINRMIDRMPDETRRAVKAYIRAWRRAFYDRWPGYFLDNVAEILATATASNPGRTLAH